MMRKYEILGCPCYAVMNNEVETLLLDLKDKSGYLVAINAEQIMLYASDKDLKKIYDQSILPYSDGAGAVLGLKFLHQAKSEKIFMATKALEFANRHSLSVYIFGAEKQSHENAVTKIKQMYPSLSIVGNRNGFENKEIVSQEIIDLQPDMTLIAIGAPAQEKFSYDLSKKIKKGLLIPCGGSLDIFSGKLTRAPKIFRDNNLEFLYRLFQQPSRIVRQVVYFKFSILLLKKIIQNRFSSFFSR